jgi:aryl-alcohol dehydrogenase-like predicted oxidoreductase
VAIAWLPHPAAVAAPVAGPRTLEQLDGVRPASQLSGPQVSG